MTAAAAVLQRHFRRRQPRSSIGLLPPRRTSGRPPAPAAFRFAAMSLPSASAASAASFAAAAVTSLLASVGRTTQLPPPPPPLPPINEHREPGAKPTEKNAAQPRHRHAGKRAAESTNASAADAIKNQSSNNSSGGKAASAAAAVSAIGGDGNERPAKRARKTVAPNGGLGAASEASVSDGLQIMGSCLPNILIVIHFCDRHNIVWGRVSAKFGK